MLTTKVSQSARLWYQNIYQKLQHTIKDPQECKTITRILLTHYLDYTFTKEVLDLPLLTTQDNVRSLWKAVERLFKHEPIQYILRSASFCGLELTMRPGVFIPRSETEELTTFISRQNIQPNPHILDLCTGSGCIALALKRMYKEAVVEALDIDPKAIALASYNAMMLRLPVHFFNLDLLTDPLPNKKWDLIVSNPPYVPMLEKVSMLPRVLRYEPHRAIFVPDRNPLVFYKKIAQVAQKHLTPQGRLYVEVHHALANSVAELFEKINLHCINIYKDLHGKDRWISSIR